MYWAADGDPIKIKALAEIGCLEYFILLNKKIAENKKQAARNQMAAAKGRSHKKR